MFLHSGASLHGHEFSPINTSATRRSPLVRAALSAPSPRSSLHDSPKPTFIRPARHLSSGPRRNSDRVSFTESETDRMSDDGFSYASEGSETTAGGTKKRRRKSTRSSASYQLAHPAPTLTRQQRLLQIRPKLLLQLQRLSQEKRPVPTIDVLPSIVVVPRLRKKFPRLFKGKGELGANDVIIVKSEDYDTPEDENDGDPGDDESLSNREVLAVICQPRGPPRSPEICLGDGSVWYGTPLPRGIFEFVTTDPSTGETTTARWVQRVSPRRSASQSTAPVGTSSPSASAADSKYLFSILHPNSRRHPILASMTQNILDIPDSYTTISSSSGRYPPTSPIRGSGFNWQPNTDENEIRERATIAVDENMRLLIQATGVWLALQLGWCPYFKYDDFSPVTITKSGPSSVSVPVYRSCSISNSLEPTKGAVAETRASTPESNQSSFNTVGGKLLRSGNHIFRSSPSNTLPASSDPTTAVPRRAISTGTAFMQRAAARRAGQAPSTVTSDSEGELIRSSPVRSATSDTIIGLANRRSMPMPPVQFNPSAALPDTPTRPFHRRVQSVFIPSSPAQKVHSNGVQGETNGHFPSPANRASDTFNGAKQLGERKVGRWGALLKFLRRSDHSAR